jgi:hypothetical protein
MSIFAHDTAYKVMKAAIIILGNSWVCPYVNTYKRAFEKLGYAYDVILWDRDGSDKCNPFRFSSGNVNLDNPFLKSVSYLRYSRFIKKTVLKNRYDRLVVSGPHLAVLLSSFLRKKYKGRYIVDYRDISVEQKPLLGRIYSKVLSDSFCNVISSSGFKKHLPGKYDYLISHNFNFDVAVNSLNCKKPQSDNATPLRILTIGYIRNYTSNVKVIQTLGNCNGFCLRFAGSGDATERLKEYVLSHGIKNVEFTGFYKKDEEESIVAECDFINIFFPDDIEHSAIMSNRFYLALIYKKPMIVTAGSVQATLVSEYGLGVVTSNCENLDNEINEYLSNFNYQTFCRRCNELLSIFVAEHCELERSIAEFMQT